jgi:hypothetical protein
MDRTENILNLFKDCIFNGELTEDTFEYDILDHLPKDLSYNYFFGATKLVIILSGTNFVIKIPYTGFITSTEEYDEDADEYVDGEEYYEDFSGADNGINNWDYCLKEVMEYQDAKKNHVEKAFAKTKIIGKINGHPIYIQERAETFWDRRHKRYENGEYKKYTKEKTSRVISRCEEKNFLCFNRDWLTDLLEYYGEKKFDQIMSFIKNAEIRDLHNENLGYIGSRPVLIDYSGYAS